ncbi:MAG: SIMPL domain-containing protein [Caldilineaceae bacterium]|nr:SIMPL domain-containing protein [Caldilineaceae bacterium]
MRKSSFGIAAFVLVIALVAGIVLGRGNFAPQIAQAQMDDAGPNRTVTVVGEGVVKIKPDIAQVTIGVEVVKPTVKEASGEANEIMDAVLASLAEAGVEEKDIQTSGFSIWVERIYGQDGSFDDEQNRYHVSNSVFATLRDLDTVGATLDAAIEAGANNIYGVTFSLDDPKSIESDARAKAVENAKAKAEELAALNDVEVGAVVSISEVVGQGGGYFGGNFAASQMAMGGGGGGGTSVSPGELSLSMQLQITYELK